MKTEIKEIYKCDFCNRLYQVKHAAIKHEQRCYKNPANDRACFGCKHLHKKSITLSKDMYFGGESTRVISVFHCNLKDIFMHLPISEHRKRTLDLIDYTNHPMPVECNERLPEYSSIDFITENMV